MNKRPPILLVRVELDELPVAIVLASTAEEEHLLHVWLSSQVQRERILQAVDNALDELARKRAA